MRQTTMITKDPKFIEALNQLPQFVSETDADVDMAYDWVAEMIGCESFVHQNDAWDLFYDCFIEATDDTN